MSTFFALLALVALAGALGLVVAVALGGSARAGARALARRHGVGAAAAVTGVSTLGSLYWSEVVGLRPCELCWGQRIFAYSLATILTVALVRGLRRPRTSDGVWGSAVPLAALGLAISIYHYLIQHTPLPSGSCDPELPCSAIEFQVFGFVTLSFMAGVAFAFVLAVALARRGPDHDPDPGPFEARAAEGALGAAQGGGAARR